MDKKTEKEKNLNMEANIATGIIVILIFGFILEKCSSDTVTIEEKNTPKTEEVLSPEDAIPEQIFNDIKSLHYDGQIMSSLMEERRVERCTEYRFKNLPKLERTAKLAEMLDTQQYYQLKLAALHLGNCVICLNNTREQCDIVTQQLKEIKKKNLYPQSPAQ